MRARIQAAEEGGDVFLRENGWQVEYEVQGWSPGPEERAEALGDLEAVFAAVAAATWGHRGGSPELPTG